MAKKPKTTPKTQPQTLVTFLLDRTGSMGTIKDATIEAFNGYLDGLRDQDNIQFSLVTFDSVSLDKVCVAVHPKKAPRLTHDNFVPRSTTNLIDSAMDVILATETLAKEGEQVVICIQTDGQENASRRFNWEQLSDKIREMQAKGWQFNFMGAGIDAYQQGAKMGLSAANTMSYDSANIGATRAAFSGRSMATAMYASGQTLNMSIGLAEKASAGDKFDPSVKVSPKTAIDPKLAAATGQFTLAKAKPKEDFKL